MGERRIIIDNLILKYEGLFEIKELLKIVDNWLIERGYNKNIKRKAESVQKGNRNFAYEIEVYKSIQATIKSVFDINIHCDEITELELTIDNKKKKINKGKIIIRFIGFLDTDFEDRWEGKPFYFMIRAAIDKWVWRVAVEKYEGIVGEDLKNMYGNIKAFLNLYRYK